MHVCGKSPEIDATPSLLSLPQFCIFTQGYGKNGLDQLVSQVV